MQTMTGLIIGSLLWYIFGYSLTFGDSIGGFIGDLFLWAYNLVNFILSAFNH